MLAHLEKGKHEGPIISFTLSLSYIRLHAHVELVEWKMPKKHCTFLFRLKLACKRWKNLLNIGDKTASLMLTHWPFCISFPGVSRLMGQPEARFVPLMAAFCNLSHWREKPDVSGCSRVFIQRERGLGLRRSQREIYAETCLLHLSDGTRGTDMTSHTHTHTQISKIPRAIYKSSFPGFTGPEFNDDHVTELIGKHEESGNSSDASSEELRGTLCCMLFEVLDVADVERKGYPYVTVVRLQFIVKYFKLIYNIFQ